MKHIAILVNHKDCKPAGSAENAGNAEKGASLFRLCNCGLNGINHLAEFASQFHSPPAFISR